MLQKQLEDKDADLTKLKQDTRASRVQELEIENRVLMSQLRRLQYICEEFATSKAAEGGVSVVELTAQLNAQKAHVVKLEEDLAQVVCVDKSVAHRVQSRKAATELSRSLDALSSKSRLHEEESK